MAIVEERIFETSKALLDEYLDPWYSDTFHDPYNLLFRGESSDLFQLIPSALREHKQKELYELSGSSYTENAIHFFGNELGHAHLEYKLMHRFYRMRKMLAMCSLLLVCMLLPVMAQADSLYEWNRSCRRKTICETKVYSGGDTNSGFRRILCFVLR